METNRKNAPGNALLLSSSSSITASKQNIKMNEPERLIIGHPFNPPHLMPLVEEVPGSNKNAKLISDTLDSNNALGKVTVLFNKETSGFVANKLQAAIFKECIDLI